MEKRGRPPPATPLTMAIGDLTRRRRSERGPHDIRAHATETAAGTDRNITLLRREIRIERNSMMEVVAARDPPRRSLHHDELERLRSYSDKQLF